MSSFFHIFSRKHVFSQSLPHFVFVELIFLEISSILQDRGV